MSRKSSRSLWSAILAVVLTACGEAPSDTAQLAAPAAQAARADIEGFKFLRLGMTLEELERLTHDKPDGLTEKVCVEDSAQAMRCLLSGITVAEARAEIETMFLATGPVQPIEKLNVPPQYHPSWQEIRLGNEASEESKTRQSQRTREGIMRENKNRELKYLAQFSLARIEIVTDGDAAAIEQALTDRYSSPSLLGDFRMWDSPTGQIVLSKAGFQTSVSYTYHPLDETRDRYYQAARKNRAGDL